MAVGTCPACGIVVLWPIVNCASIGEPDIFSCNTHGLFQGDELTWKPRVCLVCGHPECPTSEGSGWCDEMGGEHADADSNACCDMECTYG